MSDGMDKALMANMVPTHALVSEEHHDYAGSKMGMWLFLFTELILFGGAFICYAVFRFSYATDFHEAAKELNTVAGTLNTLILLTSSLTMALSVTALQKGNRKLSIILMLITVLFGALFMVNKYFEWTVKFQHGLYPGAPVLAKFPHGQILFYGLYFVMTGLHGVHVLVGMIVITTAAIIVRKRPFEYHTLDQSDLSDVSGGRLVVKDKEGKEVWTSEPFGSQIERVAFTINYQPTQKRMRQKDYVLVENVGLYWHLVDIIWIFLFPLFYLIT